MRAAAVLVLSLASAVTARANVGAPTFPGETSGEPGGLSGIAIAHEDLAFDLRPLAGGAPARVTAIYHLVNRGPERTEPLVFVSGIDEARDPRIAFDDRALADPHALSATEDAALPASWRPPLATPSLAGGAALPYEADAPVSLAFSVTIPPGEHRLEIHYAAVPARDRSARAGTVIWQLGYVLAPARAWGGFGDLDVTVRVPAGWRAAVAPALARTGDMLHAHFDHLPADTLGITAQAPIGRVHDVLEIALPLLALLVALGGPFALVALGRACGRRVRPVWPAALGGALAWAAALGAAGIGWATAGDLALPANQSASYGYGAAFGAVLAVLAALLALPLGFVITRRAAARAARATAPPG
jgi:hypothetical protein